MVRTFYWTAMHCSWARGPPGPGPSVTWFRPFLINMAPAPPALALRASACTGPTGPVATVLVLRTRSNAQVRSTVMLHVLNPLPLHRAHRARGLINFSDRRCVLNPPAGATSTCMHRCRHCTVLHESNVMCAHFAAPGA